MKPDHMTPRRAWGITLAAVGAIGLVVVLGQSSPPSPVPEAASGPSAAIAAAAAPAALAPAPTKEGRIAYARGVDSRLLDAGIESETYTWGSGATTLVVKDALAGRVRAKILSEALDFDYLRELGFEKVVYTDGFEEYGDRFEWKVPK